MNIFKIMNICQNKDQTRDFLTDNGLLLKSIECSTCQKSMKMQKKQQLSDQKVWQCSKCCGQKSIRMNSMFQSMKFPLEHILLVLYFYCVDIQPYICKRMTGEDISYDTILTWFEKFRLLCSKALLENPLIFDDDIFLGTEEVSVELDESFMGKKAKNERGTSKQTHLVFGIVQRSGRKCVLYLVDNASRQTLFPIIEKHIPKSTKIYHDGLATYANLHELNYQHDVVFHNREFVTDTGVHTNTIEGLWGLMRQRIGSMHGLKTRERLAAHLDEFSFRQNFKDETGSIWNQWLQLAQTLPNWWAGD